MKTVILLLSALAAWGQTIPTARWDNSRLSQNTSETIITPQTLSSGAFRLLATCATDGVTVAQPLYIPSVTVAGVVRNVTVGATMQGTLYAWDTDGPGCVLLWSRSLGTPRGTTTGGFCISTMYSQHLGTGNSVGIYSTPAYASGYVYAVMATSSPSYTLAKVDIATGVIASQATISGSVTGTGDPTVDTGCSADTVSGGVLSFNAAMHMQRSALTIANGNVYIQFSPYNDAHPSHGWIFSYRLTDLTRMAVWCSTPNGGLGGMWNAGGMAADSTGKLYATTGNGDYDGAANFAMSAVKFNSDLTIADWFTPSGWSTMSTNDEDICSSGPMLVEDMNRLVFGVKDLNIYSINTACMGHLGGTVGGCGPQQVFITNAVGTAGRDNGINTTGALNHKIYAGIISDHAYAFQQSGSTSNWDTTPIGISSLSYSFPGLTGFAGSSNGSANEILWATASVSGVGQLLAFNATTFAQIWSSATLTTDALGGRMRYSAPTIANGRMRVAATTGSGLTAGGKIQVYGVMPAATTLGPAVTHGAGVVIR